MTLKIGGFQGCSLQDYPRRVASIIFLVNCNFRCKYCYNIDLLSDANFKASKRKLYDNNKVLKYLERHKKMIDGVVITGGEPCVNIDLLSFIQKIKDLGLLVKLDTNGSNPELLQKLIDCKLIDYVAMDIKAPLQKYKEICDYDVVSNISKSISLLCKSTIKREFRTTVWPGFNVNDIAEIAQYIPNEKLYLQRMEQETALTTDAKTIKNYSVGDIRKMVKDNVFLCKIIVR